MMIQIFNDWCKIYVLKGLEPPFIGWMGTVKWYKPYEIFPNRANGYRSKTNIAFAQGQAGVYQIKKNGEIIYIGKGANVYKTCLRHFEAAEDGDNKQYYHKDYLNHDYKVRITLCGNIERAGRIEAMLLRKHRPRDNKYIPDEADIFATAKDLEIYNTPEPAYWEIEAPF